MTSYKLTVDGGVQVVRGPVLALIAGAAITHMQNGTIVHVRDMEMPEVVVTMGLVDAGQKIARIDEAYMLNFILAEARTLQAYCTWQTQPQTMVGWGDTLLRLIVKLAVPAPV